MEVPRLQCLIAMHIREGVSALCRWALGAVLCKCESACMVCSELGL